MTDYDKATNDIFMGRVAPRGTKEERMEDADAILRGDPVQLINTIDALRDGAAGTREELLEFLFTQGKRKLYDFVKENTK